MYKNYDVQKDTEKFSIIYMYVQMYDIGQSSGHSTGRRRHRSMRDVLGHLRLVISPPGNIFRHDIFD